MFEPELAAAGPVLLIDRSALVERVVVTAADVLFPMFGSVVELVTVAVLLIMVPLADVGSVCTTSVKAAMEPEARVAIVQVTVDVPLQFQPAAGVTETNVVPGGSV